MYQVTFRFENGQEEGKANKNLAIANRSLAVIDAMCAAWKEKTNEDPD